MQLFPGFSTVSGFKKTSVGADENCAAGSFKNAEYPFLLKICECRRPYTRSVCFLENSTTPAIVGKDPGLTMGNIAMFVRENFFGPKRSCRIWFIVIQPIAG